MALITTRAQLDEAVRHYSSVDAFAFDVETIGEDRSNPHIAKVAWLSLSTEDRSDVIPMGHPNGELVDRRMAILLSGRKKLDAGKPLESLRPSDYSKSKVELEFGAPPEQLERGEVFEALRPAFFGDAVKVGHNIKFDLHAVKKYLGDYPTGPYYDTLIASWLLDVSAKGSLGLADCYHRETGRTLEKGVGKDISLHSFDEVATYSLLDAEATWDVYRSLEERYAEGPRRTRTLRDLEMLVLEPVLLMESTGVRIDLERLEEIDADLRRDIDAARAMIYIHAGRKFNIRSNRDKQQILFGPRSEGGFGMKPLKATESASKKDPDQLEVTDYAVDNATLEHLRATSKGRAHQMVESLILHSAKVKLHGTYVLPYLGGYTSEPPGEKPKYIQSRLRNGRVYGQFVQHGTESGRFSARDPNLQNIPSRTPDGGRLREVFVADPGHTFVVADYSQIEPRIIASLSGDKTMITAYLAGDDVYEVVADRMNVSRPSGKELVLSIAYGVGATTVSQRIGCTVREARELMDFFGRKFPAIPKHKARVISTARRNRYSETIMGRRRPLPAIAWTGNDEARSMAERQAYNHLIQGSAADIMKVALFNVYAALPPSATILMTVHDEIVVQCPDDMVNEVSSIVKTEMEAAAPVSLAVPMIAEVGTGRSWKEAK